MLATQAWRLTLNTCGGHIHAGISYTQTGQYIQSEYNMTTLSPVSSCDAASVELERAHLAEVGTSRRICYGQAIAWWAQPFLCLACGAPGTHPGILVRAQSGFLPVA